MIRAVTIQANKAPHYCSLALYCWAGYTIFAESIDNFILDNIGVALER